MWVVCVCCGLAAIAAYAVHPAFPDAWMWAPALAGYLIYLWLLISRAHYKLLANKLGAERPVEYTTIFKDAAAAKFLKLNAELILPRFYPSGAGASNARFLAATGLVIAAIVLAVRQGWGPAVASLFLAMLITYTTFFFGLREKLNKKLAVRHWLTKRRPRKNPLDAAALSESAAIRFYERIIDELKFRMELRNNPDVYGAPELRPRDKAQLKRKRT